MAFIFPVRLCLCKKGPKSPDSRKKSPSAIGTTKEGARPKAETGICEKDKKSRAAKAEGLRRREKSPPNFSFSLYENDSHKMAQPKVWPSTLV